MGRALDTAIAETDAHSDPVTQLVHVARVLFESYDAEPELARQYLSASPFRTDPDGPSQRRVRQFETWVAGIVAPRAESAGVEVGHVFAAYFSLYLGLLVAGLRGDLTRAQQLDTLATTLRRLLPPEHR